MSGHSLRIGTRGSRLARWQAEWVARQIRTHHPGVSVELVEIRTEGDRDRVTPLAAIGGIGVFTKEIQRALIECEIDIAVHSLKDLPSNEPAGLTLAALPVREDPADALIAPAYGSLADLPPGSRLGTGSMRRRAQLLFFRPDLRIEAIRGNVETRVNMALDGRLDAVVLAAAGLWRLGLESRVTERLGPPAFLPAVGQGAIGVECRLDDFATATLLVPLDDPATRRAVTAERQLMAELEAGCSVPLAAWARDESSGLALDAAVLDPDGLERVAIALVGSAADPQELGCEAARKLRELGADRLLDRSRRTD